jgi:hypothetical protein
VVRAAGEASHPRDAEPHRDPCLPAVAAGRARTDPSGRARAAREAFQDDLGAVATVLEEGLEPVLEDATKAQLGAQLAGPLGVRGWNRMRKAELVRRLVEGFAAADGTGR